jgi:hypothetical protein
VARIRTLRCRAADACVSQSASNPQLIAHRSDFAVQLECLVHESDAPLYLTGRNQHAARVF